MLIKNSSMEKWNPSTGIHLNKLFEMITAVIFDMNGVITDDEDLHESATKEVFRDIGVSITSENYKAFCMGRTDLAAFKDLFDAFTIENESVENLIAKKSFKYQKLIQGNLKVYPGIIPLIKELYKDYTLALTSSSTFDEVQLVMDQLRLKKYFKVIVTSKDVKHGKPNPEPYLLTAKKLNVKSENCLVIEDSKNGIQSAKKAGMVCVAIPNTEDSSKLIEADQIIENYEILTNRFIQKF